MPTRQLTPVVDYIRRFRGAAEHAAHSDRQLLDHFARRGDGTAFAELVKRHGPMVLGVCRRVLRDSHEAEDAFQATFLLLVRKAGSLRQPESLGPWLHGVAYRTAVRARAHATRRRARESRVEDLPAPAPADDLLWRDLRPVLDEAIGGLPSKYRVPFVLCYLEGMTNAQAAQRLGCPPGTVATRLSRARERLRARLTKRGLALPAGLLGTALAQNAAPAALPPTLLGGTVKVAAAFLAGKAAPAGVIPTSIAALTEGVWRSMIVNKVRMLVVALVALGMAGTGAGFVTYRAPTGEQQAAKEAVPAPVIGQAAPVAPLPAVPLLPPKPRPSSAVHRTRNFRVEAPTLRIARLVAEAAERHRKAQALRWLSKEMPPWPEPCPIRVQISSGASGATILEFDMDKGRVIKQEMHLEGPLDQILASALPHEVTHTVFAHFFGAPVPRWADEGAAVLSEDEDEQKRYEHNARTIIKTPGRLIPLRRLFAMHDFPKDVMALFAEGYSVTRFLVERKDHGTFLKFVKQGAAGGWDQAVQTHYGYGDVEKLEDAWLASLRKERGNEARPALPSGPLERPKEGQPPRLLALHLNARALVALERPKEGQPPRLIGAVPVTVIAFVNKQGDLILRQPCNTYQPVTSYVQIPGEEAVKPVTSYSLVVVERISSCPAAKVKAYDTDGNPVDAEKLAKQLRKETPVLAATDGRKVDPFHLQLIKKGTLILVVPVRPPAPPPGPAVDPTPVSAPPVPFPAPAVAPPPPPTQSGQGQSRANETGPDVQLSLPLVGPVPVALDFGFPVTKEPGDRDRAFNFWMGFFR